jgi:hypothetical protein
MFAQVPQDVVLKAIWASKALPKLKVFLWTLMIDRLNTRGIILRKHWNIETGPECSMCNASVLETRDHQFFGCDFAGSCWDYIGIIWATDADFTAKFISTQTSLQGPCFWKLWHVLVGTFGRCRMSLSLMGDPAL